MQVETVLEDEFASGRVLASISSRPGQCGRSDGYILEGKELEFYLKKIKSKKGRSKLFLKTNSLLVAVWLLFPTGLDNVVALTDTSWKAKNSNST